MEEGLDTGPYCAQVSVGIHDKNTLRLTEDLAQAGGRLLMDALPAIMDGSVRWTAQDESKATYAKKIDKGDLRLSPELSAGDAVLRVRAATASAPARLVLGGRGACAVEAYVLSGAELAPGELRFERHDGQQLALLGCATAQEALALVRVKPDGKREMAAADWLRGFRYDEELRWG